MIQVPGWGSVCNHQGIVRDLSSPSLDYDVAIAHTTLKIIKYPFSKPYSGRGVICTCIK